MKKQLLFLFVFCFSAATVLGQYTRCSSTEYNQALMENDPSFKVNLENFEELIRKQAAENTYQNRSAVVTIPVVFHILYSSSAHNIPKARIEAQMDVLNEDFSATNIDINNVPAAFLPDIGNSQIQFCLAERDPFGNASDGIVRKQTTTTSFSTNNGIKFDSQGGDNAWPRNDYLNIWVGNLGGGLLGYAQFPGGSAATDGVVLLYRSVGGPSAPGTAAPYHLGRTGSHEIGHWLNLRHIWGDSFCGNDFVNDTPTQDGSNFGCKTFPNISNCTGSAPNGDMYMNYMDYVDDNCMIMFSNGQAVRMNTAINSLRPNILNSLGCVPVTVGLNDPVQDGISIYPNPTNGSLFIRNSRNLGNSAVVKIYNMQGQETLVMNIEKFNGSQIINMDKLSDGLYFIDVVSGEQRLKYKVLLSK
jgi:Pregnancy-associated plasma protein-A/Secretion system C-terminal sorting domain